MDAVDGEITSFKMERNVEVLRIHLSSREVAETKSVKIRPLLGK